MTVNMESFQALLAKMRDEFIGELLERCNNLDDLILMLEKFPQDTEAFNELYRGVHSLKGSGGTHGLSIITTICHQLENLLTDTASKNNFGASFATRALAFVDLLRKVEKQSGHDNQNFSAIEKDLEALRKSGLESRKSVLIVESSRLMVEVFKRALEVLPLQLTVEENGLTALSLLLHESFDLVIVGREIKGLNGIALMAAVRASQVRNRGIPAILVSSKAVAVADYVGFIANIRRDKELDTNVLKHVRHALEI